MKQHWNERELVEQWTLTEAEKELLNQRTDHGRIGFAVLLKYLQIEDRFPIYHREPPALAVDFLAQQLALPASAWLDFSMKGSSSERARAIIRAYSGYHPVTVADAEQLQSYLLQHVVPQDQEARHLRSAALDWCRAHKIEPPSNGRTDRIMKSAVHTFETAFFAEIQEKLSLAIWHQLDQLLIDSELDKDLLSPEQESDWSVFSKLKTDPGRVGLASVLKEIAKLKRIDNIQLPRDLFAGVPVKTLERYRLRITTESVQELQRHPESIRYPLLAAFCWQRRKAIIDSLIELMIQVIHRISVRAEKKVVKEVIGDLEKIYGKTNLLYRLAEAAMQQPDGVIREVLFPVVGEQTLAALVKEYHAKGPVYRRHVHTLLRSSYSHHYRIMLPPILDALTFRSNNTTHQPIIKALVWLKANRNSHKQFIACDEVPIDSVVRPQLQELLLESDPQGDQRINRINYEICVLQSLREGLKCKEIWVEGADQYRNPDDDLPSDYDSKRQDYYDVLTQPKDVEYFIGSLQQAMQNALSELAVNLPNNPKVTLRSYGKKRIILSKSEPQSEPVELVRLKAEVARRWPMTTLLDILKETDLRTSFTDVFKSLGTRETLDRSTLQRRLLLCLYGLGTNAGIKRMLPSNRDLSYRELLYIRHRFIEKNALREAIHRVVNATFSERLTHIWGEGTAACAADGKKFGAWDQNLMTEWHIRYGGKGVMIYWHVEKNSACIYSQLKRCSSSEVASMIEGVLRHCTDMEIEQQYVDSKGQSEVAFAFCHLLGFNLLPRLKGISSQKLYRPVSGRPDDYANLQPILIRPINWELIRQQYDEMIKFTTALRLGTAEPEAILRRFTRNNRKHPTYLALAELGKAVKTIFLCQYLLSEPLRIEINEGLNVVENWNSGFL